MLVVLHGQPWAMLLELRKIERRNRTGALRLEGRRTAGIFTDYEAAIA